MTVMAENTTSEVLCKVAADDVKCPNEINAETCAAPGGETRNLSSESKHGGEQVRVSVDMVDHLADRKKKRRRKTKRKTPYNKVASENKGKKLIRYISQKKMSRYKQPEAPYNSNRFLIEDHNDLKDVDVDLMAAANNVSLDNNVTSYQKSPQRGRVRDSSFTSVESDEDFFYSSPEDEEEFLTKEFSNTYKDLHVESLASLSKAELIQHILTLEEKMDITQKKLEALNQSKSDSPSTSMADKLTYFQDEISKLVIANKTLLHENEELRKQRRTSSITSSEDSESDSSSSTCSSSSSSHSNLSDELPANGPHSHQNGDITPEKENLMDTENVT